VMGAHHDGRMSGGEITGVEPDALCYILALDFRLFDSHELSMCDTLRVGTGIPGAHVLWLRTALVKTTAMLAVAS